MPIPSLPNNVLFRPCLSALIENVGSAGRGDGGQGGQGGHGRQGRKPTINKQQRTTNY